MRTFQIISLTVFILLYLLLFVGSLMNLKKIVQSAVYRKIRYFLLFLNLLVIVGFIILYVYPFSAKGASNFPLYFYFNTLLLALFLFNLPLAFALLVHSITGRRKRKPVIPFAGLILAVGLASGIFYGSFIGSRLINVNQIEITFPDLPQEFHDYRIVHLSDFHLGGLIAPEKLLERSKEKLKDIHPDLILFTGDLVNNFAAETIGLEEDLQEITAKAPAYSILGNHDYGDYTNWESDEKKEANFRKIMEAQERFGFTLLKNEHVVLKKENDSIFLTGVENWGNPPFPQYAELDVSLEGIPANAFILLMTHDPAHWEEKVAGKREIRLTLSGHTHGLQWALKPAGIPLSLAYFTRATWGGLYNKGDQFLYVNTGLGTVGMPWRLDMPAEITLITLK